ncbi:MAG: Jag N-terminal domain-containing protein [Clostridia bacterium]|nr:Jag N-terminal domain-containing protein [Clostridia bacterium]
MRIEQTGTGVTVEEAYENAKVLLAAPEDVEIHKEIIQFPKKKLFGLKTEPAKVTAWYEKEDPAPKPVKQQERPAKQEKQNAPKQAKPAQKKEQPKAAAPAKTEQPKAAPEEELTRTPVALPENDRTAAYLKMIVSGMGIEQCEISLEKIEETEEFVYNISCGTADGVLIGRRGETLDAIQYLVRLSENKGLDENKHRKISVNVGDYREKRNDNLRALAAKNARRVLKYGRNVALEPMSPYERRIIHTAIQGIEGVTSHSVGSDANRKVIITLEEGVKPTNPSKGGYGKDRSGYARDRGGYARDRGGRRDGGRGYQKREPYQPAVTREPRKDSEGSLYGKIEIPPKTEE